MAFHTLIPFAPLPMSLWHKFFKHHGVGHVIFLDTSLVEQFLSVPLLFWIVLTCLIFPTQLKPQKETLSHGMLVFRNYHTAEAPFEFIYLLNKLTMCCRDVLHLQNQWLPGVGTFCLAHRLLTRPLEHVFVSAPLHSIKASKVHLLFLLSICVSHCSS